MSQHYSYDYDISYYPAMPVVEIGIGKAFSSIATTVKALVDSGADATVVPIAMLQEIGAQRGSRMWMRGLAGGRKLVDLYFVSFRLGTLNQARLEIVGDREGEELVVGRDVLNHLTVILNGPGGTVEIVDEGE